MEKLTHTIIVGDLNITFIAMDSSSRQKVNKKILALSDTLYQINLIDTYRTFQPQRTEYTFLSAKRTFSRIHHMLGHNEFNKTEIISSIFSNHYGVKMEINYKKKARKTTKMWRLNNMLLNN